MSDTRIQPMPDEFKTLLASMGMDERDAELCGVLSQKVRDFVLDEISDENEQVTTLDMAIAAVALKMTSAWLEHVAREESGV